MKNPKLVFLVLAALIGLVFLAGCVQQPAGMQIQFVCSDGRVVMDKNSCPTQAGGTAGVSARQLTVEEELTACSGMPLTQSGSFEDLCITGLAGKHEDTSLCAKLPRDQKLSCYNLVAQTKNDPSICEQAEFQEEQCFEQYAREEKDASVCELIKTVGTKDSCYNNLSNQLGDPTLCSKILSADQKDNCNFSAAQRLRDSAYCNKITREDLKQNCLQNLGGGLSQPVMQK